MHIIGRGRHGREVYPEANRGVIAFQDRLIATEQILPGFTPSGSPMSSLIGAALVTPKASGIFVLLASVVLLSPSANDTFGLTVVPGTGNGLSVSGGSVTVGGWTFGTTVPPVVGGVVTLNNPFSVVAESPPSGPGKDGTLVAVGANDTPLPRGVASVIQMLIASTTGTTSLGAMTMQATLIELP